MIYLFKIASQSLWNRKISTLLTIFSIAMSIMLFLGVERVRQGAKESFSNTISKTDLVVGARGSEIQLLLYTVFHMGNATNNISWHTYNHFKNNSDVAWTIPFSLGDSYNGHRVIATDQNFYLHYQFFGNKKIEFKEGNTPNDIYDVALGAEMATKENLKLGDNIALTHGISEGLGILIHKDKPFTVTAILKETGTPIDRAAFITLEGMEAIHIDWQNGVPAINKKNANTQKIKKEDIKIEQITSFLIGANSRISSLSLQREINNYKKEPIMGVIPGVALSQLWETVSYAETALQIVSIFVVIIGLIGMMVSLYTSLESRRREMAILRAIGAGRIVIVHLLVAEAIFLSFSGCLFGVFFCYFFVACIQSLLLQNLGILISLTALSFHEYLYLIFVVILSALISHIPAIKAYRNSLIDGLSIRT
ncbi:ABC transporter permease [Fluviispira multicolorata]|uniref:FtsX-like permease family protein n=1 Tax=Fluviispira multicolorata TaxID=2654512 RepID=A0A833JH23_9BACT|nr:ABC transporter permease [Fluviispira multicolorata]KAB8033252.1 FtsX-like permease family protein [Fluviispira multicolorata]